MLTALPELEALPTKKFQFVGGELCLDYCNTMGGKREAIPRENLHSYYHFLAWCCQAGLVNENQVGILARTAASDPGKASEVLGRGLDLREASYRIFLALMQKSAPCDCDLGVLNAELSRNLGRLRVKPRKDSPGFGWGWVDEPLELASPLGPVAYSIANLLSSEELLTKLHQCGGDNCGWLFLDSSRNHSRRWCDMRDCGNRAKVRRHRQKQQSEGCA